MHWNWRPAVGAMWSELRGLLWLSDFALLIVAFGLWVHHTVEWPVVREIWLSSALLAVLLATIELRRAKRQRTR